MLDERTAEVLYTMRQQGILHSADYKAIVRDLLWAKAADFAAAQPIILEWLSRARCWCRVGLEHTPVLEMLGLTETQARAMLAKLELQRIRGPRIIGGVSIGWVSSVKGSK